MSDKPVRYEVWRINTGKPGAVNILIDTFRENFLAHSLAHSLPGNHQYVVIRQEIL